MSSWEVVLWSNFWCAWLQAPPRLWQQQGMMARLSCQRCRSQVSALPISHVPLCVCMFPASQCRSQLGLGMQAAIGSCKGASGHPGELMRTAWPGAIPAGRMGARHCLWAPGTAA